jgi:hypothetical protein
LVRALPLLLSQTALVKVEQANAKNCELTLAQSEQLFRELRDRLELETHEQRLPNPGAASRFMCAMARVERQSREDARHGSER